MNYFQKIEKKIDTLILEYNKYDFFKNIIRHYQEIKENIKSQINSILNNILFFSDKEKLVSKINSFKTYLFNSYFIYLNNTKFKEKDFIFEPMFLFCNLIHQMVNFHQDINISNITNHDENIVYSLSYIIKCLDVYGKDSKGIISSFMKNSKKQLINMMINIYNITSDIIQANKSKNTKGDLYNYLIYMEIPLVIVYHSLEKISLLYKSLGLLNDTNEVMIINLFESILCQQLTSLHNYLISTNYLSENSLGSMSSKNLLSSSLINDELKICESVYRHKLYEINFYISDDKLPLLYKNYVFFNDICLRNLNISFLQILNYCSILTSQNFILIKKRSIYSSKNYFEYQNIIFDYENDNKNFKFFTEIITEVTKLKYIFDYAIDKTYFEIENCLNIILTKFFNNTKNLVELLGKDCVYYNLLQSLKKNIIEKKNQKDFYTQASSDEINSYIEQFIFQVINSPKGIDSIVLLSKNYNILEMFSKFLSNSEKLIIDLTNFFELITKYQNCEKNEKKCENLEKISYQFYILVIIFKIELFSLMIFPLNRMINTQYWLQEPQMHPENSMTSIALLSKTYLALFKLNLSSEKFSFISHNYLQVINSLFIKNMANLQTNSINIYGINLLIRDFEFIQNTISPILDEKNKEKEKTIFNFINYIKLLTVSQEQLEDELNKYYQIEKYEQYFIDPILSIRTNTRKTINEMNKEEIITQIFSKKE